MNAEQMLALPFTWRAFLVFTKGVHGVPEDWSLLQSGFSPRAVELLAGDD